MNAQELENTREAISAAERAWREHQSDEWMLGYRSDGYMLRVKRGKPDIVETSNGYSAPRTFARSLWSYAKRAHRKRLAFSLTTGYYDKTQGGRISWQVSFTHHGHVYVGCTFVTFDELRRYALAQGWPDVRW